MGYGRFLAPVRFETGAVEAITRIQSNFGSTGNLGLIARVGAQLHFYWRDSGPAFRRNGPFILATLPAMDAGATSQFAYRTRRERVWVPS